MDEKDPTKAGDDRKLIIILERANLDVVKVDGVYGKSSSYQLINCDEHINLIRKLKKDPAFCRPDIIYQCLQILSQCPLNRANRLRVFVRTQNNELFRVDPQLLVPSKFTDFTDMMIQLLHNLRPVRAKKCSKQLLKLIKNPVTMHLPIGTHIYGTSSKAKRIVRPSELVPTNDTKCNDIAIVIGAMAHESCEPDYIHETVSISRFPLSAALVCAKVTSAFEQAWNIK